MTLSGFVALVVISLSPSLSLSLAHTHTRAHRDTHMYRMHTYIETDSNKPNLVHIHAEWDTHFMHNRACSFLSVHMVIFFAYLFDLQKKLDFTLKVIGGDISTIPGLSDAIDVCLNSIIKFCL